MISTWQARIHGYSSQVTLLPCLVRPGRIGIIECIEIERKEGDSEGGVAFRFHSLPADT